MLSQINLNDIKVLKLLIENKMKYTRIYNNELTLSKDIICLYASLEDLINKSGLDSCQKEILNLKMQGFENKEIKKMIAHKFNKKIGVGEKLTLIYKKMLKTNKKIHEKTLKRYRVY